MSDLLLLVLAAALMNNLVLVHLVGVTPLFAASRRFDVARGLGLCTIIVLPLTTLATALLHTYWLQPRGLEHMTLLLFVFTGAAVIYGSMPFVARLRPQYAENLGVFLPLLLASNTVLGTALLNIRQEHSIPETVAFSLGSSVGFALLLLAFACQRERLAAAEIPQPFRGNAIAFVSLALTAMAFLGIAGLFRI